MTEMIESEGRFADKRSACERLLDYEFENPQLLEEALLHASSSGSRLNSNERLEFLGDAILGLVASELLFQKYPDWLEGELTQLKSVIVSRASCARITRRMGLEAFMTVGKGVTRNQKTPDSLLANVFESVIAAIYLDGGIEVARQFILCQLRSELDQAVAGELEKNFKSEFQQYCQKVFGDSPTYALLAERGPDHNKNFKVCAVVDGRQFPAAWGENKKSAEQRAAGNAMATVNGDPLPFPSSNRKTT